MRTFHVEAGAGRKRCVASGDVPAAKQCEPGTQLHNAEVACDVRLLRVDESLERKGQGDGRCGK